MKFAYDKLKEIREARQMSLSTLGAKVNISKSALCLYESGKRTPPLTTIGDLAKALGCAPTDLLDMGTLP
jgi:transcriptional regulator with XRE-family HTH domain